MWFLPKDYVSVSTRVEQFHAKFPKWSMDTSFEINWNIVIFKTKVSMWDDRTFTWHSFWTVWKEKAFEKLETVSVGRALAFAWFETTSGIASREEMEVFNDNWLTFDDYVESIQMETDIEHIKTLFIQCNNTLKMSETQLDILKWEARKRTDYLNGEASKNVLPNHI